jgi:hypothetical protein
MNNSALIDVLIGFILLSLLVYVLYVIANPPPKCDFELEFNGDKVCVEIEEKK